MAQPELIKDIEARVKDTGDTMTGNLTIRHNGNPQFVVDNTNVDGRVGYMYQSSSDSSVCISNYKDSNNRQLLYIMPETADVKNAVKIYRNVNGTQSTYALYGTHNKPTASDIGAVKKSGDTMTGNLTIETGSVPQLCTLNTSTGRKLIVEAPGNNVNLVNYKDGNNNVYLRLYNEDVTDGSYLKIQARKDGTAGTNYPVLHSGNVSKYALPISGGNVTGGLGANNGKVVLSGYDDANNSLGQLQAVKDSNNSALLQIERPLDNTTNPVVSLYQKKNGAAFTKVGTMLHSGIISSYAYSSTASRNANTVLAAPNGSAGNATFRTLVAADIPSLPASKITSGTLPVTRGGTGATDAATARTNLGVAYGTAAGTVCQGNDSRLSNARTPTAHNQAASTITAGTFPATGIKAATGTDYTTARIRNIQASTTDLTAGSSALANGNIYLVYE